MRSRFLIVAIALSASACTGSVFSLEVGTCFDDDAAADTEISSVPVVECAEPHDNEVYAVFDIADGDFPGLEVIQSDATEECVTRFEAWAGIAFTDSTLLVYPITPTQDSWERLDDREVACAAYDEAGAKLTGSMAGAGV